MAIFSDSFELSKAVFDNDRMTLRSPFTPNYDLTGSIFTLNIYFEHIGHRNMKVGEKFSILFFKL